MQSWFTIEFNGETWRSEKVAVDSSLFDVLKQHGVIDSTIEADRDQGGVLVVVLDRDQNRNPVFRAIDSGSVPLVALAGRRVWTIEGLREQFPDHPLWEVEQSYPGIEIHPTRRDNLSALMFEWCSLPGGRTRTQLPAGYISRTADYSRVRSMMKDLEEVSYDASRVIGEKVESLQELQYLDGGEERFYRPQTIVEYFDWSRRATNVNILAGALKIPAANGSGETESSPRTLVSVEAVDELRMLENEESHWEIGSAVPLTEVLDVLGGEYPGLAKALIRYESAPIRNRATLGGQLNCPLGRLELGPILLALDTRVQLVSEEGSRDLTLDSLYGNGQDKTLRPNEIIKGVTIPRSTPEMLRARGCNVRLCDAYKVARRRALCPAMITAAFAVELEEKGVITRASLVYGGLGTRPLLASRTATGLQGKSWNQETVIAALKTLDEEMSTLGGLEHEDGLRLMAGSLFQKFFHQHPREKDVLPRRLGVVEQRLMGKI